MSDAAADHGAEVVEKARTSFVVEVEKMLAESERWKAQSIYKVPEWIKSMNNIKAYRPQVVALGPLHHDDPDLMPMEEHKRRAVVYFVNQSSKPLQAYIAAVEEVAEQLEAAYGKDLSESWRGENRHRFVEVMVADGCFLLMLMVWGEQDYTHNDPVFGEHGRLYMWKFIHTDVLMIENQLPLLVLERLLAVRSDKTPSATEINSMALQFLGRTLPGDMSELPLGLHLLHLYHSSVIYRRGSVTEETVACACEIMPCAVEIHEAGIHFRKSESDSLLDIHFKHGVFSMPELTVDDGFEYIFLNLMVFERLHASVGNDVTAYVFFMDNIVDSAEDVSLLSCKGIVKNNLGSDKEVAKLFNDTLSAGAVLFPSSMIHDVQHQVDTHCKKPWNKWRANFMHIYTCFTHIYMSYKSYVKTSPWVFISFLAATILLVVTLLQTVYTVVFFYKS